MIDEVTREIRNMQTHSSSAVAIAAANALRELTDRDHPSIDEFMRDLEYNSTSLRQANPSHASLQNTQRAIVERVREADPDDLATATDALSTAIDDVIDRVDRAKVEAARNTLELLEDGDALLTHDFSSTVLSVARQASETGMDIDAFVTEARPRFLGRRMARQLSAIPRVEVTMIVDSAAGHFLAECDRVVIGMSCIVGDTLYNRIGTYSIGASAAQRDVPVTVVGAGTKVIDEGFAFENDYRAAVEVMREPTDAFSIRNPAYDATPLSLIDSVVTDEGIHHP